MIRPARLDRRLTKALAPVVERLDGIETTIGTTAAKVVEQATAKVADAEQRAAAISAQAGERVIFAERQAADTVAAVRAELAAKVEETALVPWRELRRERDQLADHAANCLRQRDEALGEVEHLRALVETLTIERDEARRQHDVARSELLFEAGRSALHADLVDAARAVLPDLADALPHRPHGGSRTRARRRMEALAALAALVNQTDDDTTTHNQEASA